MILSQLRDLKEGQRDLNKRMDRIENRMDRIENRMDKLETKIETTRQELNDKLDENRRELNQRMDRLENKIDASTSHGQIATISSVGVGLSAVSITLGVLYALIFK